MSIRIYLSHRLIFFQYDFVCIMDYSVIYGICRCCLKYPLKRLWFMVVLLPNTSNLASSFCPNPATLISFFGYSAYHKFHIINNKRGLINADRLHETLYLFFGGTKLLNSMTLYAIFINLKTGGLKDAI